MECNEKYTCQRVPEVQPLHPLTQSVPAPLLPPDILSDDDSTETLEPNLSHVQAGRASKAEQQVVTSLEIECAASCNSSGATPALASHSALIICEPSVAGSTEDVLVQPALTQVETGHGTEVTDNISASISPCAASSTAGNCNVREQSIERAPTDVLAEESERSISELERSGFGCLDVDYIDLAGDGQADKTTGLSSSCCRHSEARLQPGGHALAVSSDDPLVSDDRGIVLEAPQETASEAVEAVGAVDCVPHELRAARSQGPASSLQPDRATSPIGSETRHLDVDMEVRSCVFHLNSGAESDSEEPTDEHTESNDAERLKSKAPEMVAHASFAPPDRSQTVAKFDVEGDPDGSLDCLGLASTKNKLKDSGTSSVGEEDPNSVGMPEAIDARPMPREELVREDGQRHDEILVDAANGAPTISHAYCILDVDESCAVGGGGPCEIPQNAVPDLVSLDDALAVGSDPVVCDRSPRSVASVVLSINDGAKPIAISAGAASSKLPSGGARESDAAGHPAISDQAWHALEMVAMQAQAEEAAWRSCEVEIQNRAKAAGQKLHAEMAVMHSCLRDAAEPKPLRDASEWTGAGVALRSWHQTAVQSDEEVRQNLRRAEDAEQQAAKERAKEAVEDRCNRFEEEVHRLQTLKDEHGCAAEHFCARERQLEELVSFSRGGKERAERARDVQAEQFLEESDLCERLRIELRDSCSEARTQEAQAALARLQLVQQIQQKHSKLVWCPSIRMSGRRHAPADTELQQTLEQVAADISSEQAVARNRQHEATEEIEAARRDAQAARQEEAALRSQLLEANRRLHSDGVTIEVPVASETLVAAANSSPIVGEAALDGAQRTSSASFGDAANVVLVTEAPLAVRIPRFELHWEILSSKVNYTVVLECPGKTMTITKSYTEFRELHAVLRTKPFAHTLQAPPLDWLFAALSSTLLERRRRQLETYLASLCTHAGVLRDDTIWHWFDADELTQVLVRIVVADAVDDGPELARLIQAVVSLTESASDSQLARCVHPAVLNVVGKSLRLAPRDSAHLGVICRLLTKLLPYHRQARQLLLSTPSDGVSALLDAATGGVGRVSLEAVEAVKAVLHALVELDDQADPWPLRRPSGSHDPGSSPAGAQSDDGLGDCCVCMDRGKSHALLPCGHLCVCMGCADFLSARASGVRSSDSRHDCPVCRRPIERAVQIFV